MSFISLPILHIILSTIILPDDHISVKCNEDFALLVDSPRYIDKTHLLSLFFRQTTPPYNFLTCPRLFGKTTVLNMIETFAQIQVDKHGNRVRWSDTKAYETFKTLTIARTAGHILTEHMAAYPVILLNLHFDDIEGFTEQEMVSRLNKQIQKCFKFTVMKEAREHNPNANGSTFKPWNFTADLQDKAFMAQVVHGRLNQAEIRNALYRLCKILYHCFHRTKVIVLVDNYDSAAVKAMSAATKPTGVSLFYNLINTMISQASTIGSDYLKYMLITGTSSLPYYRDHWRLENITHRAFLDDHAFTQFCGLLDQDVARIFDKFQCNETEKAGVKEFYNGYSTGTEHLAIYNPYSIRRYFQPQPRVLRSFWAIKPRIAIIVKFMPFGQFFENLFLPATTGNKVANNFTLLKTYQPESYGRMFELLDLLRDLPNNQERLSRDRNIFLPIIHTFAFEQGYLTHAKKTTFVVPNKEVGKELIDKSVEYFSKPVYLL